MSEMRDRPKALRLFIGARVSLATVRSLEEAVQVMRRSSERVRLRWVAPASYHITLKFLGWTRPEVAFAVRDRMAAALAGQRGFELETRGLGAFPSPERARVLWAGVDEAGGARLTELARRVEGTAEELGFAREDRPFHPHVTLARLAAPSDVRGVIGCCPEQMFRLSWVDSVVLFESHMKSTGSEYDEKTRWPLEVDSKPSRRHTGPVENETELADELPLDDPSGDDFAPEGAADRVEDEEQHDDGD
jgi:2'-5' RNA ligase